MKKKLSIQDFEPKARIVIQKVNNINTQRKENGNNLNSERKQLQFTAESQRK